MLVSFKGKQATLSNVCSTESNCSGQNNNFTVTEHKYTNTNTLSCTSCARSDLFQLQYSSQSLQAVFSLFSARFFVLSVCFQPVSVQCQAGFLHADLVCCLLTHKEEVVLLNITSFLFAEGEQIF